MIKVAYLCELSVAHGTRSPDALKVHTIKEKP